MLRALGTRTVFPWYVGQLLPGMLLVAAYGLWVAFRGFWLEIDWTVLEAAARFLEARSRSVAEVRRRSSTTAA